MLDSTSCHDTRLGKDVDEGERHDVEYDVDVGMGISCGRVLCGNVSLPLFAFATYPAAKPRHEHADDASPQQTAKDVARKVYPEIYASPAVDQRPGYEKYR